MVRAAPLMRWSEFSHLVCVRALSRLSRPDIKLASFAEHSPMLNDITAVKTWDKVNSGLLKMYRAEVLAKFAVVQHFIYSSLLPK